MITQSHLDLTSGPHGVLLLHGLSGSNLEVSRLAQRLHAEGFSVYAPNIQGYCFETDCLPYQAWLDAATAAFEKLQQRCDTVSICGLSMGATLALALAEHHEDVNSLALLATCMDYEGWAVPWYQVFLPVLSLLPFKLKMEFPEEPPFGVKNDEIRGRMRHSLITKKYAEIGGYSIPLDKIQEGRKLISYVKSDLEAIHCPVMAMHAIEDEICSLKSVEEVIKKISSTRKELIYLDDCYHLITIDNQKNLVYSETSLFLKDSVNKKIGMEFFRSPKFLHPEAIRLEQRR
jgi:carboxylesterase